MSHNSSNGRYLATFSYPVIAVFQRHLRLVLRKYREKSRRKAAELASHTHTINLCIHTFYSHYRHLIHINLYFNNILCFLGKVIKISENH